MNFFFFFSLLFLVLLKDSALVACGGFSVVVS